MCTGLEPQAFFEGGLERTKSEANEQGNDRSDQKSSNLMSTSSLDAEIVKLSSCQILSRLVHSIRVWMHRLSPIKICGFHPRVALVGIAKRSQ